jgi:hypothetical protein
MIMPTRFMLLLGLVAATQVQAAESAPHNIWFGYSRDETGITTRSALLSLSMTPDDLLILGAGQTDTPDNSTTLTTDDYSVTYSTFRLFPWSLDAGYDHWGKSNELIVDTFKLAPAWHGKRWMLGINMEVRSLAFYTRYLKIINSQREVDVDSEGIGPVLGLNMENWSWSLTGMNYSYSKDISALTLPRLALIFGRPTYSHATTLTDWYATTVLNYRFPKFGAGLKYNHSVSALTSEASNTVSLLGNIKLSKTIGLDLEAGRAYTPNNITTDFGSIGLSVDF